jgi:hypothetical protein
MKAQYRRAALFYSYVINNGARQYSKRSATKTGKQ